MIPDIIAQELKYRYGIDVRKIRDSVEYDTPEGTAYIHSYPPLFSVGLEIGHRYRLLLTGTWDEAEHLFTHLCHEPLSVLVNLASNPLPRLILSKLLREDFWHYAQRIYRISTEVYSVDQFQAIAESMGISKFREQWDRISKNMDMGYIII